MIQRKWVSYAEQRPQFYRETKALPSPLGVGGLQRAWDWGCERLGLDPRRVRLGWAVPEAEAQGLPAAPQHMVYQRAAAMTVPEGDGRAAVLLTPDWMKSGHRDQVQGLWHELTHAYQILHQGQRASFSPAQRAWCERDAEQKAWGLVAQWERLVRTGQERPLW